METETKPHAPAISRALSRAGFFRHDMETTSVRGWYRYAPGFRVEREGNRVLVYHETLDSSPDKDQRPTRIQRAEALPRYRDALRDAGYAASVLDGRVVVSARCGQ